jgi:hypothetical protein
MRYGSLLSQIIGRALRRPALLLLMARVGWRFRRRDWHRRWPFLPLPPADYLAWRLHTAFGDEERVPSAQEIEVYLRWAQRVGKR